MRTRPALVSLLSFLVACGAAPEDVGELPPEPPGATEDAGTGALDSGALPEERDAGQTADAGLQADAGPIDAGAATPDAGASTHDAGASTHDAGASTVDAGAPPRFEAVFSTRPVNDARSLAIETRLTQLIDAAVAGSSIRVAIFNFTRGGPAQALLRAAQRGVDVRVVVDGAAPATAGSEVPTLQAGLGSQRVHVCDSPGTACVGSGIMHHKTFLFSALADGSRNVVVQASHNLTATQLSMHNNALIIRGDAALYAAYLRTWEDLERDVEIANYYRTDDGDLATRVYFFPRPTGGDTVASILGNVTCDSTARIRVAMAFFTNARASVATALAARAQEGCDVRVVAGDAEIPLGSTVASTLASAGVQLTRYPERTGGWTVHSKYLLIDARYAGSAARRRLVFTGSHNWTGPALTINDETLLRVEDDGVFAAYLADWAHVQASAARP